MSALDSPLDVSPGLDWLGRIVGGTPRAWIAAGTIETALVGTDIPVEKPVYICGLARSGSTVLLETLAAQPGVVTHRYQDFPFLFTPYWWNLLLKFIPRAKSKRERAHGDGILVNAESPEAMEEMLWIAFFHSLHDEQSEVLDAATQNPAFAKFYREHIQKLLLVRGGNRYVSKENYNVTRMAYLQTLFPDARFIVPVRDPVSHIASLMRQHARFCEAGKKNPRVIRHMSFAGHFEFGLNRMPIHTGDNKRFSAIQEAWQRGEEVRGWALYWDAIYGFVHQQLQTNPALKKQVLLVPFEKLCAFPDEMTQKIFSHADLSITEDERKKLATTFRAPDYYQPTFTETDKALIKEITGNTAKLFGY